MQGNILNAALKTAFSKSTLIDNGSISFGGGSLHTLLKYMRS
jgi:hypothetical protein